METGAPETAIAEELFRLFINQSDDSVISDPAVFVTNRPTVANESENPFVMAWWAQLAYALAFGLMMAVATIGNLIVIWAVLSHKVMSSATNYFLVNVSVADLMMATFNAMFNFAFMIHSDWPFGAVYCTINNFVATLTVALSVFSLMAISVDRYTAIMKPLSPRMPKHVAVAIIVVIWVASCLLSLPNLLYSKTVGITYRDGSVRTLCFLRWPDGISAYSKLDYSYNVVLLVLTYILPISAMSFTYLQIGRELWGSTYIGECCDKQIANIKSKKRVVRMFILVVSIFAVCWLPYHAYFIYIAHHKTAMSSKYIQHIYLIIYFVAMSSSMYNPIIYFKMNARFRQYFMTVLRCCRKPQGSNGCGHSLTYSHPHCHTMSERQFSIQRPSRRLSEKSNGHSNGIKDNDFRRTSIQSTASKRSYKAQEGHNIVSKESSKCMPLNSWYKNPNTGVVL